MSEVKLSVQLEKKGIWGILQEAITLIRFSSFEDVGEVWKVRCVSMCSPNQSLSIQFIHSL